MLSSSLLAAAAWSAGVAGQLAVPTTQTTILGAPIPGNYTGALRPQIHFSPPQNFMNDPNGLHLAADGTYHLYYQCEPSLLHGSTRC